MIIVLAAIRPAIGLVAATLDWLRDRRSYPPEERKTLLGLEGILCAAGVFAVLVVALSLGASLWNTVV